MDVGVTEGVIFYFGVILFECQKQFGGYNSHDGLSRYEKKVRICLLTKVNVKGNYTRRFKCRRVCLLAR